MESSDLGYFSSLNLSKVWEFSLRLSRDQRIAEDLVELAYALVSEGVDVSLPNSSALVRLFALVYSIWDCSFRQSSSSWVDGQRWGTVPAFSDLRRDDHPRRKSKSQRLIDAIESLPETMRISLMLLTVESLTYADVAIVINQTEEKVYSSVMQARAIVDALCG
jgi:RNA polymerase sigma-70 factor (ECF subfamily)